MAVSGGLNFNHRAPTPNPNPRAEGRTAPKARLQTFDLSVLLLSVPLQELEELWAFRALLTELTRRLTYCVQAELIPLMEVAGVMQVRWFSRGRSVWAPRF